MDLLYFVDERLKLISYFYENRFLRTFGAAEPAKPFLTKAFGIRGWSENKAAIKCIGECCRESTPTTPHTSAEITPLRAEPVL